MPRFSLHVGSEAFWAAAAADVASAGARMLIQAMTFEGDAAGQRVARAIIDCRAADRRVLVDDYTRHVINDRFLAGTRDGALQAEAKATWAMFNAITASGADLRLTNPIGLSPLRYATRNHKKLLVLDDVAWIGGINFSDHNFAWHDMMVRVDDAGIADWLAGEFVRDWSGKTASNQAQLPGMDLYSLDGSANEAGFAPILELFAGARQSIEVVSAYPTFPFVDAMIAAARRGVAVRLYTPRPNNKPVIRDYLLGAAGEIDLQLTPMMTHAKAALVDGEALVVGSSNFDFVSHRANAEYVAVVREPRLIADFVAEVLQPLREGAGPPGPDDRSRWRSWRAGLGLRLADRLLRHLTPGPRVAEWRGGEGSGGR